MQDYDVQKHKGHLIYAAATPAEGNKRWHAEGIVFSKDFPKRVEEIHYMKSKSDFPTEKQARDYAIALCKLDRSWETEEKFVASLKGRLSRVGSFRYALSLCWLSLRAFLLPFDLPRYLGNSVRTKYGRQSQQLVGHCFAANDAAMFGRSGVSGVK